MLPLNFINFENPQAIRKAALLWKLFFLVCWGGGESEGGCLILHVVNQFLDFKLCCYYWPRFHGIRQLETEEVPWMLLIIWIMQKNRGYNNTAYVYRQGAHPFLLAKETEENRGCWISLSKAVLLRISCWKAVLLVARHLVHWSVITLAVITT